MINITCASFSYLVSVFSNSVFIYHLFCSVTCLFSCVRCVICVFLCIVSIRQYLQYIYIYIYIYLYIYALTKIINATLFHELNSKIEDFTQKAYFSQILFTNLCKSVLVNEIIHPPHRCGISRCWLDSMIIAQVCLSLATIKGHSWW